MQVVKNEGTLDFEKSFGIYLRENNYTFSIIFKVIKICFCATITSVFCKEASALKKK